MTEVGFYHLQRAPLERALPKLLEKVLQAGHRAVLMAGSDERLEALDSLLWIYEQRSWLPHGTAAAGYAAEQPVYLTTAEENPNQADVLVLVDGVRPEFVGRFERVLDMFDGRDDAAVQAARERWSDYKANDFTVTYWQQIERGWEKKA